MRVLGALLAGVAVFALVAQLSGHGRALALRLPRTQGDRRRPGQAVWLAQAGVAVTPAQFAAARTALGLLALVVVWGAAGSAFVAGPPALAVAWLPKAYFAQRRSVRLGQVVAAWPDGIRQVIAAARARGTVHQGLVELAHRGPAPLAEAFAGYPALARTAGTVTALETIRDQLADPTTDRIIEVLIVAHEQGQLLAMRILRDLATMVAEDAKVLEELASASLAQRLDARITFVLPWLVLVALCVGAPAYRAFYASAGGAVVVAIGAAMSVGGMAMVSRLARLPAERRVLGGVQ